MKLTDHRILSLWRDDPAWAPTFGELREALGVRRNQQRRLSHLLDDLQGQGTLRQRGRRYHLSDGATLPPAEARGTRTRPVTTARAEGDGLVGVFSAHPNGFGFVELTGERDALFIPPKAIGGALDGDRVRAQRRGGGGRQRTSGRIVEVLERRHARIRGHLRHEYRQCWMAPFSEKLPMIFIAEAEDAPAWPDGTIVEAEITAFPEHHDEAPEGRIVQVFEGDADAPEQVVLHILADLAVAPDFSPATDAEMRRLDARRLFDTAGREDLRELPFVTIDGEDARDFDDAVCLLPLRGGGQRLLVSIADVAAYVAPGTAVDGDAYRKGTSVYFPNQVFPMLPERLSNDLCSLRPEEPRLALTCDMELDREGRRVRHRIHESVIRSQARLTYTQVQRFFDDGERGKLRPELAEMLTGMRRLAATLRERRRKRGALDFSFPEYKFDLDRKGFPKRVREVWATEATRLIEQFMLEANETVAEHCAEHDLPILYRVHDPPPPDTAQSLAVTLLNFGLEVSEGDLLKPGAIQALVKRAETHPQREQVEVAILRSLSQAQYRARNDGHFALAATYYCHFTSPIRRYPDLLVHRALKASFGGKRRPFHLASDAGLHLSVCERTAGEAEGRVVRLYKVLYMEPRLGEVFPAAVSNVSDRGLWLRLRDEPVDGLLPADALPMAAPRYDRDRNRLVPRGKGPSVGLGDRLCATLARADRLTQQLDFGFARWGWEDGDPQPKAPAERARRERGGKSAQPRGRTRAQDAARQSVTKGGGKPAAKGSATGRKTGGKSSPKGHGKSGGKPASKGRSR